MTRTAYTQRLVAALLAIRDARDYHAEQGTYPPAPRGPGVGQEFDDWAADLADRTVRNNGRA